MRHTRCLGVFWLATASALLAAATPAPPTIPAASNLLARLTTEHPRLLARAADFERLRSQSRAEAPWSEWKQKIEKDATDLLHQDPSRYEIPDGLRLLSTSRRVLQRVQTLGLMFQLTGERRHADRAWRELEAAAAFPDWNPRHFLDTAEMTHAFAIGYDWLYDVWTPAQRDQLRRAMVEKGLEPALQSYRGGQHGWWAKSQHNWNQVCNGGIGMGALALGDVEPALAGEILHRALQSLPLAMRHFAPDGAWNEGPGYWNYATAYNFVFLAALESALGTDFGLSQIPGTSETGWFPIHLTGPTGRTFNYSDGGDGAIRAPQMFWLARKYGRPAFATYQQEWARPHPLDLLWYEKAPTAAVEPPLARWFREAEVVTLRSAWSDPDAVFIGFKAGDNKANHSNLDLGSFVLDALGERWAVDLGADNYNLPGYFGAQRWTYYRLRAEGHNTLLIHPGTGPDQDPKAAAAILRFGDQPERSFATADLTKAYPGQARRAHRGVALLDRRRVIVQDELETTAPADVWWFLHTGAEIELKPEGNAAILQKGGRRLEARILTPASARFTVREARPLETSPAPPKQNDNAGIRKLAIRLPDVQKLTLVVELTPLRDGAMAAAAPLTVRPLAEW